MKKYSWILVVAAVAPLFPLACGGGTTGTTSTGSGGGSGGGSTTGTTTATTTATGTGTTTTTAATGTGGAAPIDCTTVFPAGDCDTCGQANCCAEASACNDAAGCVECLPDASLCDDTNMDQHDALIACLQASCDKECFPPPPVADATCVVPTPSPSAGACISITADNKCNPVTNAPCDTAAGEACDFGGAGYQCYPAPNDKKLCEPCGMADGFCQGGETCDGVCVKFCCDDTDCGVGKCDKGLMFPGGVGECLGNGGGTSSSSGSSGSSSGSSGSGSGSSSSVSSSVSSAAASGSSSSTGP